MVILMVGIGGFTRLSKAGLSITEWKPITGTLPPLGGQDWLQEKLKYETTPEYKAFNYGMSMEEFQAIYLIEYVHRLVARLTGLVFVLPFIYFTLRRKISKKVVIRLFVALLFGALQAFAGWYMVKSGLVTEPHIWIPTSRTQLHKHCDIRVTFTKKDVIPVLNTGIQLLLCSRLACLFKVKFPGSQCLGTGMTGFQSTNSSIYYTILILILVAIQIIFGAFVAGLNAGLVYNTFPLMDGHIIPEDLFFLHPIWLNIFENRATVQFIHRALALLILVLTVILTIKNASIKPVYAVLLSVIIQIILGVVTLLLYIPIAIAIAHQDK
ncbi:UNVERIFIED_CONTAM: ctaA [Trichonephila clavipes]